jgi:hypothetical protein
MLLLLSHLNNLLNQQHNICLLHIHHQLLNLLVHTPLLLLDLLPMLSLVLLAMLLLARGLDHEDRHLEQHHEGMDLDH